MIRAKALPIAPKQFVCVLDAITIGLIFYALSNAELDHGGCVCGNLGSIELVVNQRYEVPGQMVEAAASRPEGPSGLVQVSSRGSNDGLRIERAVAQGTGPRNMSYINYC